MASLYLLPPLIDEAALESELGLAGLQGSTRCRCHGTDFAVDDVLLSSDHRLYLVRFCFMLGGELRLLAEELRVAARLCCEPVCLFRAQNSCASCRNVCCP